MMDRENCCVLSGAYRHLIHDDDFQHALSENKLVCYRDGGVVLSQPLIR